MDRPSYEDRQNRRFQPASERSNRFGSERFYREERYMQDEKDSDRPLRSGRDLRDDVSGRPWNDGSHEGYDARSHSYQDLGSQPFSSNRDRDYDREGKPLDRYQDSNLSGRNSSRNSAWDDRPLSTQRNGSSYPTSSYGSSYATGTQADRNWNANQHSYGNADQAPYGRTDQGNFGSYGPSQTFGSQVYQGSRYGQSYGSQGYSPNNYGTQHSGSDFGQHYGTGQSLDGNDGFVSSNKSGRGPKGYKRSDERIKEEVCELLTRHPAIDPSEVDIQVSSSEITLTGTVDNRHEKRLIEDLASSVSGVSEVNNRLRVHDAKSSSSDKDTQSRGTSSYFEEKGSGQGSQASKSVQ